MKKLLLATTTIVALMAAESAGAADLPTYQPVFKVPPPAPALTWTGFYVGLGGGMRSSGTDAATTSITEGVPPAPANLTAAATSQPLDGTAFRVNPYAGFNWQMAPQWVVGVEGDVGFANQTTTLGGFLGSPAFGSSEISVDGLAIKTTWDASARGRIGFLVTPATLLYATGGVAWQHYDVTSTCADVINCVGMLTPAVIGNSVTKAGLTVGGGIETALWGHWFARADYRYADFGASPFNLTRASPVAGFNPTVDNFNVAMRTHTATFGLAYKFGDPVAAGNSTGAFPVKAPPVAVSWNGFYTGLGLGMRSSRTDVATTSFVEGSFLPLNLTGNAASLPLDGTAFRASPYFGFNWQMAPQWVAGIEGDVGFANQTTTLAGFPFSPAFGSTDLSANGLAVKTMWDASARGRIGFLVTPATLLYATGGAAWQHYDVTSTCVSGFCVRNGLTPAVIGNSVTKPGWTVGGGIETALGGHWFARADYRYADFGASPFNLTRASTNAQLNPIVDNFDVAMRTHTATLGVGYRF